MRKSTQKIIVIGIIVVVGLSLVFIEIPSSWVIEPVQPNMTMELPDNAHFRDHSIGLLVPLLTANAYSVPGFYQYFAGSCDESCLTVEVTYDLKFGFTSSGVGLQLLSGLGVGIIDEYRFSKDISMIDQYDTILVLHSEYVTKEMFNALQEHQQVFYLYPNALYAEVEINDGYMTLIRGHNYPTKNIVNGFDWQWENTHPYEYDTKCDEPTWRETHNGYQLMCYPEVAFFSHPEILEFVHDNLI